MCIRDSTDTLSPLHVVINIKGIKEPRDIVVCRHDRQLYVANFEYSIWRVSVDDRSYVKWLTTQVKVWTLSLTSQHLLVTSHRPPTVCQYSTTNKELLCVVQLPQYVSRLYHAVETTHGTFVISYICRIDTSQDKQQYAVSELFSFCHVLQH